MPIMDTNITMAGMAPACGRSTAGAAVAAAVAAADTERGSVVVVMADVDGVDTAVPGSAPLMDVLPAALVVAMAIAGTIMWSGSTAASVHRAWDWPASKVKVLQSYLSTRIAPPAVRSDAFRRNSAAPLHSCAFGGIS